MDERLTRRGFLGAAGKTAGTVGLGALFLGGLEGVASDFLRPGLACAGVRGGMTRPCPTSPGTVTFPLSEVISSNASPADQSALVSAITDFWTRWLAYDVSGTVGHMTSDVTRLSGNWGVSRIWQGAADVAANLRDEWDSGEYAGGKRSNGAAEELAISRAEIWVDPSGDFATVCYWMFSLEGFRWCDSEFVWVLQVLAKESGAWKICYQTEGWSSDFDPATMTGTEQFRFDWFSPAANLHRAIDFYTPILGTPESVTSDQATWVFFRGSRFVVDATRLGGLVKITPGVCNGWPVIYVDDVASERDRLAAAGVEFIGGTATTLAATPAGDSYAIGLDDPVGGSKNIFVIMQRNCATTGPSPASPSGFDLADPYQAASQSLAAAWVSQDASAISSAFGTTGRFYDDTRDRALGAVTGGANIASVLSSTLWSRYDRGSAGLSADLIASSVRTRSIGSRMIVSYLMTLTGTGVHPFRETAFATDVFDADKKVVHMVRIASDVQHSGMVLALDYSDIPTHDLPPARKFYETTMGWGKPYRDVEYRGFWADDQVVYGISRANGALRPGKANGYMSFWVPSARGAYRRLQRQGAGFPTIMWINSERKGVSYWPGYTEVGFTDSEGSVNVCTEYTGR